MADFAAGSPLTASNLVNRTKDFVSGQYRTTTDTATSGTTEKVTVTSSAVNLLASTLYLVTYSCYWLNSVNADQFAFRIRSTNVSGTIRNGIVGHPGAGGGAYQTHVTAMYLTTTAESGVVFVGTLVRLTGTGTATPDVQTKISVERVADSGVFTTV